MLLSVEIRRLSIGSATSVSRSLQLCRHAARLAPGPGRTDDEGVRAKPVRHGPTQLDGSAVVRAQVSPKDDAPLVQQDHSPPRSATVALDLEFDPYDIVVGAKAEPELARA